MDTQQPSDKPQSKFKDYYQKGWETFLSTCAPASVEEKYKARTQAYSLLAAAYKEPEATDSDKEDIAGLIALVLTYMEDYKNAEAWANLSPNSVWTKLARYDIELDKLLGHRGYLAPLNESLLGLTANLVTVGIDKARIRSKREAVKQAAIEAAKAIHDSAHTAAEPGQRAPLEWVVYTGVLGDIIDNMWANDMKEAYLCTVILEMPWDKLTDEQRWKELQDYIDDLNVTIQGYLGRMN